VTPPLSAIVKRNGRLVPFGREKITLAIYKAAAAVGGHDRALSERLTDEVVAALEGGYAGETPSVEDVQDVVERVLIKNGHARTAKAYILYRHERARMRSERKAERIENIPYKQLWQMLDWAFSHDCETVAKLNAIFADGRLPWLVGEADARYESILDDAAQQILERRDRLRFIIVAGPSSSGKTTTTLKIGERLAKAGIHVLPLAMDNYFFDLEHHPRDEFGDYDFETPEALDLALVNRHLAELEAGRGVDVPTYDFKTGKRTAKTTRFDPEPRSLILLDTLHGLYPGLTESVSAEHKFKVYIETIGQLKDAAGSYVRWADVRMLRRMIRDSQHRSYSPEKTVLHWHYVRRSELKHIIPHQAGADFHMNGALPYELPFLKRHCFSHLPGFLERWRHDERRLDGYIRARRVHDLLQSLPDVEDESLVPATSVLREFIGGGSYKVH
jgi:uridine kinase